MGPKEGKEGTNCLSQSFVCCFCCIVTLVCLKSLFVSVTIFTLITVKVTVCIGLVLSAELCQFVWCLSRMFNEKVIFLIEKKQHKQENNRRYKRMYNINSVELEKPNKAETHSDNHLGILRGAPLGR